MVCFYFMVFYSMYKSFSKTASNTQLPSTATDGIMDYIFTKNAASSIEPYRSTLRYPLLANETLSVLWETPLTIFQIHNDISMKQSTTPVLGGMNFEKTRHWRTGTVVGVGKDPFEQHKYLVQFDQNSPMWINLQDTVFQIIRPIETITCISDTQSDQTDSSNGFDSNLSTFAEMVKRKTTINYDIIYNHYPKTFESDILNSPITTLDQLIQLADDFLDFKILQTQYGRYTHSNNHHHCIDFEKLVNTIEPLIELNNMIGMDEFKNNIMTHVMYHLQSLHGDEMNHIAIEGPPGVGKTTVGKILGQIYYRMGFLTSGKFKIVKSHDLIGQYIGQTAPKTQAVLDECHGGVLFIDEAYTLGNGAGKRDNYFGKDCIDTINQHLSEHKNNFLLIIAGYGDQLDKNFFSINPGLERRFPWRYQLQPYSLDEIVQIFTKIAHSANWQFSVDTLPAIHDTFGKHFNYFNNNGGDCETLFYKCKLAYSRRQFNAMPNNPTDRHSMTLVDIQEGFEEFIKTKTISQQHVKKRKPDLMDILNMAK